ncbi:MAG: acetylxylan esterase [Draconibacterium sp.]|nr:acetylxylan esterase [Draconibacterium sp.]
MRNSFIKTAVFIFVTVTIFSCNSNKKRQAEKVELCQGAYLTEEAAVEKLKEFSATFSNKKEWEKRAVKIRAQIKKGAELDKIAQSDWNFPIKITHGEKYQMIGYTVENIGLELKPGYIVHGNIYMPDSITGKVPAILNPHGHWFEGADYGRFRPDMQYRCSAFAKMGAIAINWDMYGTGEDVAHKHHSPEALTMQTFNTLRILDYISSLPQTDTDRIIITGASGGGTQTFIAAAIDDRFDISVPTVMVSAYFYGGCVCESGKPIHKSANFETNNVEIAACFAPKPQLLNSDGDDWTKNVPDVEFPYIKNIYKLYGAEDNIENAHFIDEVHNYGISKRKATYHFLAKHAALKLNNILDKNGEIDESFVLLLDTTQLKVFPERALVVDPMESRKQK